MSEYVNIKGVVVRETNLRESDKLLTVVSFEKGKLAVNCRGVRSMKSKRFSAAELYAYSDMTLLYKDGVYSLKEAELIESFYGIRYDIESFAASSYFSEILESVCIENQPDPELVSLFLNSMYLLANRKDKPIPFIKSVYELRTALEEGLAPDVSCCSVCAGADSPGYLDIANGVFVCADCFHSELSSQEGGRFLVPLGRDSLRLARSILAAPSKRAFSFSPDRQVISELSYASEKYLLYHTGGNYNTLEFLHSVVQM